MTPSPAGGSPDAIRGAGLIEHWLREREPELTEQIRLALRATMFSNRLEMRPAQFSRIAGDEASALLTYVANFDERAVFDHGCQLCRAGLGKESLLQIGKALRRYVYAHAPEELRLDGLDKLETYQSHIIQGFIAAHTELTLEEQERIRSAIQRAVSRYAVQMDVAADVARAATSILDLDELLQTSVELIHERFGLYYVAIFLTDADQRWAYLQASAGEAGQIILRRGHRLKIGGDSLVGWCIANGVPRIALDVGEKAISFDTALLSEIHSEMVIPLSSRGKVIGAMAIQNQQVGGFSSQDLGAIRITADQLANAIANARLFRERERQISELSTLNDMSRSLAAALDFETLLQTTHQQIGRFYELSHFAIATYSAEDGTWRMVYDVRAGRAMPVPSDEQRGGLIAHIAAQGQPLLLDNLRDQSGARQIDAVASLDSEVCSWMGVPLIAASTVVGVLIIASTAHETRYSERDLVFLNTIAAPVAIALINARLYQRLREELLDRERTARELREAKEAAEGASRAKSTFLANMSHELRTPLTGIIGYSELLQRDAQHHGYSDLIPDLEKIHMAGKHLLAIINDILDLSKIESGKMQIFVETFDLSQLLAEVQVTASPLIKRNRNQLEVQIPATLGVMRSDLTKIRQVVLNLLSNAAKFTEGGQIRLVAEREQHGGREWVVISISDTGIGIGTEQLRRLFQEFAQADASMTRRYGGTGLGLALSRRLCDMLGGIIEVQSELGVGSTFTARFPAEASDYGAPVLSATAPYESPPRIEAASPQQRRETVLVIDDDPDTRDMLTRRLSDGGLDVITAATGEEGLALVRALRPSVVTLDVLLPGMDGWAVLDAIKQSPDLADIPVVMLTILDEPGKGFMQGASAYLTKPVNSQNLIDILHQHTLDGQAYRVVAAKVAPVERPRPPEDQPTHE